MTALEATAARSYSARREAVSWTFAMSTDADEASAGRVRSAVVAACEAADSVGAVSQILWSTRGAGEFGLRQIGPTFDAATIDLALSGGGELFGAVVAIDLHIDEPEGSEARLPGALSVYVESDDSDGGVFVVIRLGTNVYADVTTDGDNRAVAALNRGKLSAFLRTLRDRLGLTLFDLEAGMFKGQVDETGFLGER